VANRGNYSSRLIVQQVEEFFRAILDNVAHPSTESFFTPKYYHYLSSVPTLPDLSSQLEIFTFAVAQQRAIKATSHSRERLDRSQGKYPKYQLT
jgi:hypothetical protein